MSITAAYMVPHPPLILPEIGQGEEEKIKATVEAYHQAARQVAEHKPETIVVLSPHTVMYSDYFHIRPGKRLTGDFGQFRAAQVKIEAENDLEFVNALCETALERDFPWGTEGAREKSLDHGSMIPLYFINQYYRSYKLASIGLSGLSLPMHYQFGQAIKKTAEALKRRTVIIASGDLSHYLKEEGPYGFRPEGPRYDARIMDVMERADFGELLAFSDAFCNEAGECGHRAFTVMAGTLDQTAVAARRLSYEGVFGVGYGICTYQAEGEDPARDFLAQHKAKAQDAESPWEAGEEPYVALAKRALEAYVKNGICIDVPKGLPPEMLDDRAGAFVSIHKNGDLRGCIGTIGPVRENIAREIVENAISAGTRDPRFPAVAEEELAELSYSVDILGKPERIDSIEALDVKHYGVIVSKGSRRGLLLPDLEGIDTPVQQVAIAAQKAGLRPDEQGLLLERFQVIRHGEKK